MKKLHPDSYFAFLIDKGVYKRVISHKETPEKCDHLIEIGFYAYIGWAMGHIGNLTAKKMYSTYMPANTMNHILSKHIFDEFIYLKQTKRNINKLKSEYGLTLTIDKKKKEYFKYYIRYCLKNSIVKFNTFFYIRIWFKLLYI